MPDTIFTRDLDEIYKFFKKNKKIIVKPIHSFGGNDIHLLQRKINKKLILNFIKKHGHIMCQSFLPKIKDGDKVKIVPDCEHLFHQSCLDIWLLRSFKCPNCNLQIDVDQNMREKRAYERRLNIIMGRRNPPALMYV